ncbi:MAG TPA: T9SS type A sorting domain-containing protein [Chitinophagales bacterium]|nr:T9SS type A sorting domain-containing protein [Chitinophagales bacterium]
MKHFFLFAFFTMALVANTMAANNAIYEQRRSDYVDSSLIAVNGTKLILQAYRDLPLDTNALNNKLNNIFTGQTSDFDIIELVRILYLTNGEYDAKILPVLNSVPYWVNKGDTVRNYWSENHMIMWSGSDWLLHEKYNRPIHPSVRARIVHYLDLKIQYGYYEFFSSVYTPYCLSGIINLADFAQDAEIKEKAILASQRLLDELLMLTNDKGVFFPVAGRNYPSKYKTPYGQNHNNLIYLLTGLGQAPNGSSAAGPFLASSTLPVDTIINSWRPIMDTTFYIGHTLDTGFILNSGMTAVDKVVFQWSSGAYFHPAVVQETVQLLEDSSLWDQVDFALLKPLQPIITPQSAPALAEELSCISKSTVISGQTVSIFKHNAITLSSVPDFWKGKVGFQQHTCVANVGTTAVYLGSGEVHADWEDRNANNANTHQPYVEQKKNLALLMYRPEDTPPLLGANFAFKDVALHFRNGDYDEVVQDSLWIIGRQQQGYVAVRRHCLGQVDGVDACPTAGGQAWAIMVGDSTMYGSFANFKSLVHNSQFEERWYIDTATSQYVYYAKIVADTITIDYAWGKDTVLNTGIGNIQTDALATNLYPNPVTDVLNIDLSAFAGQQVAIKVVNMVGQQIFGEQTTATAKTVQTGNWSKGVYFVTIETAGNRHTARVVKQ